MYLKICTAAVGFLALTCMQPAEIATINNNTETVADYPITGWPTIPEGDIPLQAETPESIEVVSEGEVMITGPEETVAEGPVISEDAEPENVQEEVLSIEETPSDIQEEPVQEASVEQTISDTELLAKLIWHEAKGEPYEGKVAVGEVVMNRVHSGVYPNSISEVIYSPGQFADANELSGQKPSEEVLTIAQQCIDGTNADILEDNVLHFRNPALCGAEATDNWGSHIFVKQINNHSFYT